MLQKLKLLFLRKKKSNIDINDCKHLKWSEESSDNGWRSNCLRCKQKAYGSCQG